MNYHLKHRLHRRLSDIETPVSIYLKLRDHFAETILLESADHTNPENDFSYICCDPIAGITVDKGKLITTYPDGQATQKIIDRQTDIASEINNYISSYTTDKMEHPFSVNGLFGYFSYNAARYFEDIDIKAADNSEKSIPDIRLNIYRYVVVQDHFRNECFIVTFYLDGDEPAQVNIINDYLHTKHLATYPFHTVSEERSNFSDKAFLSVIEKGKVHCHLGDVFQVVLSRGFEISFSGDEFNVYRALRSINPSPYLFYFDYGSYRLFGSSPEAQLKINNGKATIHPIAGTYRRTGDKEKDKVQAEALRNDAKENAEHTMLIDLARNDLSKTYRTVEVPVYKKLHFYSHVIHIVSEVTGSDAVKQISPAEVLAGTFPAGTLSGAPKHRAMQLINEYEDSRGFYGGCIGFIGFSGDFNQAIMIRSFMSKGNKLHYRAGAGIVAASTPANELMEVNNKVAALRKAIEKANTTAL